MPSNELVLKTPTTATNNYHSLAEPSHIQLVKRILCGFSYWINYQSDQKRGVYWKFLLSMDVEDKPSHSTHSRSLLFTPAECHVHVQSCSCFSPFQNVWWGDWCAHNRCPSFQNPKERTGSAVCVITVNHDGRSVFLCMLHLSISSIYSRWLASIRWNLPFPFLRFVLSFWLISIFLCYCDAMFFDNSVDYLNR